jgi:hypothetical protein
MNQTILIEQRQVYGNTVYYPVNEPAQVFAKIANTKTLLPNTINLAKQLGYSVELKQPETPFFKTIF